MNLRNRSLLILGLTFFVFFIIIAAVSLSVTLSGLDRLEYQDIGEAVNQTQLAIHSESITLLGTTQDWGWWDDMDHFAVYHNTDFIDRNANPANMATVKVHLFMVMDENGSPIYSRILSPDFQTNESVPVDILAIIRNNPGLTHHDANDPGTCGVVIFPEGPMIIASAPILKSDKSGPPHGAILMGRYLEYGPIQRINGMTGYDVTLDWTGKEGPGKTLPAGPDRLPEEHNLVLIANNESTITGYSLMNDLTGKDLIVGVSMGRELYRTGFSNITTYLVLLALWAVMTGLIVVIVMDRTVLRRMGMLTDHVRSFARNREEVPVPVLTGNDELAELEKTIIASRMDLLISEQQLRVFVNGMPGPAALFTREGRILLANSSFTQYLSKRPEEISGSDIRSLFPPKELEKYERFAKEAIRKKESVHFENETGGKTILMSFYPVLGKDGEVIQLGLLTFDISERKRLENALQKVTKKISLLNTVIFNDIQNKIFVQMGYLELSRPLATDPRLITNLEKEEEAVREIQASLQFAKQYNDMGINPPRWQNVMEVMVFGMSHLDLGSLKRDLQLEGLEIYADSLLERVFLSLVENVILHAEDATIIRAGFSITDEGALIFVEDDGTGIPAGNKELIFNKGIGTGGAVGLFLSREILSITGITIQETGIPGQGARFEMLVPKGSYRLNFR